jgi:hypothetical protein
VSYTQKIDVLDLIIQTIQEHEQKLDQLVERLENAAGLLDMKQYLAERGGEIRR